MVNFRFHLVSLTAVFLALAAGIAIGAGVVDRQTVDFLEARLRTVENNRAETNAANDRLQADIDDWERFTEEAGDRMVEGRLDGVPVLAVAVQGTDRDLVDRTRTTLQTAGAALQGTVWLTEKWSLANGDDVAALASVVGASATSRPDDLRGLAVASMVSTWTAGTVGDVVVPLRDAGFLEFDPSPGQPLTLDQVALGTANVVLISAANAAVPSDDLVVPLARAFVESGVAVVAAQPEAPEVEDDAEAPPLAAAMAIRADDGLVARVPTVDNVDDYRGRVALVFALDELVEGRTGHYGTGDGAERLLPEAPA